MTTPPTPPSSPGTLSDADLIRGVLAADYEVLEELGRGGMAIVYRAREIALDREVAIKVLPGRLAIDKDFIERFEHEARTAGRLEHPNIVPIYRVGRAGPNNDVIYFVMKLLRGQSLSAVLSERGKLDVGEVRRVLIETASALGYAAKRNVVHRDIKPDNILLDSEGRCVVTDFGIAKAPGGQQTAAGTSLGTPRYMSPEHAQGVPLDGRSDMYSLGVVAYQCLTGRTPFEADDPFAVLYKHINEPVPDPTLETPEQRQLYSVIARMLAKKPGDRFQTGDELMAALGGHVSMPTLVATVPTSPGLMQATEIIPTPLPWTRYMKPGKQRAWAIAGGVAVLAIGAYLATRAPRARPSAAVTGAVAAGGTTGVRPIVASERLARDNAAATPAAVGEPPKPAGPSARAAAILAANKLTSSCPKRDTLVKSKPIQYSVIADPIKDQPKAAALPVGFDVCGLAAASPITVHFKLTKLKQRGFGQQKPYEEMIVESTGSTRSRERHVIDIKQLFEKKVLSDGEYQLDVRVTDAKKRQAVTSRNFKILK